MAPEVKDMELFLAVARDGSFGRAAATLLVAQPSVSERIGHLERDLGVRLFDRTNRGVSLTTAGQRLLPYAERTVAVMKEAADAARSAEHAPPLRVTVHSTFSHRVVPLVLDALTDLPRALELRDAHSDQIVAMLLDGVTDVGFVMPGASVRGLRYVGLPADPVIGICHPDHPLARKRTVPLELLADQFVALNVWGTDVARYVEQLERAGVTGWRRRECSDANTAIRLARAHDHIAFVTTSAVADDLAAGTLVRVNVRPEPRWTVPLALAYHERSHTDPVIVALRASVARATATRSRSIRRARSSAR